MMEYHDSCCPGPDYGSARCGGLRDEMSSAAPTARTLWHGLRAHAVRITFVVAIVGFAVLTSQWTGAQTSDQCSGALSNGVLGTATGCGVVVTVTAVDDSGNATAFVVSVTGNGNPYDGTEDTLIGIQNGSGGSLRSITLSSANTTFGGLFNFDNDGPCRFLASDCYPNPPIEGYTSTGYEGSNNTFSNVSNDVCGQHTCHESGVVNFISPIPNGGSSWFALEGTPQSIAVTQNGSPINPNNPANLTQSFLFNNATNQAVEFDFDYSPSFNKQDLNVVSNTNPSVSDQGITHATYKAMVTGTALATTDCYTAPGQGTDAGGNALCAQLTLTCTNDSSSTPEGDNCPQSVERNLFFSHVTETPGTITIPAGTAPFLAMGSDTWSPANCTLIGPEAGNLCPQSTLTQFQLTSLDPVPHSGGTGRTSNSGYIAGCCEPEWNTLAQVPLWSNSTTVPVSFTANPPQAPNPNSNNWVAAPNKSITWGAELLGATPDTTFPVPQDQTVANPNGCPSAWPSVGTVPPSFMANGNVSVSAEGAYEVHFFSTACHDQEELVFPSTITTASTKNLATFKTVPFNVDSTKPVVSNIALNSPTGFYTQNSTATAVVSCADPSSPTIPNFFSGIAKCGAQGSPQMFGGAQTAITTPISLSTSTLGMQTFTAGATDVAGNGSAPVSVTYQVVGSADLAVGLFGNFVVKSGARLTYFIGVANSGPNTANLVTITDNLPQGTTYVSSGYAIESCNLSGGRPVCSISPPKNSCGSVPGSCSIGTLPAWTRNNPIGALIQITVTVNARPNAILTDTAAVAEANSDPNSKNNTAQWITFVTR